MKFMSMPLIAEKNQEVTLPSSRFLFRKLKWGRKTFHTLVSLYGKLYQNLWKNHRFEYFKRLGLIGLLMVFISIPYRFIHLFTYLFVYSLICFLSHLFSLLLLTFILPIYYFWYLLSHSILDYLLCIHFIISLCS